MLQHTDQCTCPHISSFVHVEKVKVAGFSIRQWDDTHRHAHTLNAYMRSSCYGTVSINTGRLSLQLTNQDVVMSILIQGKLAKEGYHNKVNMEILFSYHD